MERARTQWQYGDWESLRAIDVAALANHPDRAKLALLAAAGHLQAGELAAARGLLRHAADWGCSKRLVSQVLVASVHNVLGRAACITGREEKARNHFEQSIVTVSPNTDTRLLGHARSVREMVRLGLLPQAAAYASDAAKEARQPQLAAAHARAHQKVRLEGGRRAQWAARPEDANEAAVAEPAAAPAGERAEPASSAAVNRLSKTADAAQATQGGLAGDAVATKPSTGVGKPPALMLNFEDGAVPGEPAHNANPTSPVPYDEALLDRVRTQWQLGDWASLAAINQQPLQHHPDRTKLALMAAVGLHQLGRAEEAKTLTRQALDWGCSPLLVRQMLIFGIQNSLARANAILE